MDGEMVGELRWSHRAVKGNYRPGPICAMCLVAAPCPIIVLLGEREEMRHAISELQRQVSGLAVALGFRDAGLDMWDARLAERDAEIARLRAALEEAKGNLQWATGGWNLTGWGDGTTLAAARETLHGKYIPAIDAALAQPATEVEP